MLKKSILFALLPLLFLEGAWVRLMIPRLKEPSGPKNGVAGEGRPLRILIAGDSSAAGVGVSNPELTLYGRLAKHLEDSFRMQWQVVARTGWTTGEVTHALGQLPAQKYDIVLTAAGINDLTGRTGVSEAFKLQCRMIEMIRKQFTPDLILISGLPPVHRFPSLPQPLRWVLGDRARQLDAAIGSWAAKQIGCEHIPLDFPIGEGTMASDGFHPGPVIYDMWAAAAAKMILALNVKLS